MWKSCRQIQAPNVLGSVLILSPESIFYNFSAFSVLNILSVDDNLVAHMSRVITRDYVGVQISELQM